MTREEQIKQQAMSVIGVPPELSLLECFRLGFKEGAKWADNNPKEYREKIEQLEIKYFELFKKAREEDKQELIEKACRWLEENAKLYSEDVAINCLLANFKVAMEDLK